MSLLRTILAHALKHPRRTAVVDDRRTVSYAQLALGSMLLARLIRRTTDRPHVGVMLPTSAAFPVSLLGCWINRRTMVPLNYLLKPDDLAFVAADSEIDTILTATPMVEFLGGEEKLRELIPPGVKLVMLDREPLGKVPPLRWPPSHHDDDLAALLYTSGTSGRPKGVMLTHGNLTANARAAITHSGLRSADTFLGVLPQFHSFGFTALTLIPLVLGSKVVYTARFVPRRIVELIRTHRPQIFMAVPSMYAALLSVKSATREDFSSLTLCISGGEPLPQAVFDGMQERLGVRLMEGYGLTETSPVAHWSTPTTWKHKSVGLALPGVRTMIVDVNEQPVATGGEGEVWLAGPNLMKGYFKRPEANAEVFVERDGVRWFRTGDYGRLEPDGHLFITGRKKEMLIIAGENVFPREIEEVLDRHPAVKASAVIGQPDELRGEVPVAFVEMREGVEFIAEALRAHCREFLPAYKVPREVRHLDPLPRNPTGKVLRRELKAMLHGN